MTSVKDGFASLGRTLPSNVDGVYVEYEPGIVLCICACGCVACGCVRSWAWRWTCVPCRCAHVLDGDVLHVLYLLHVLHVLHVHVVVRMWMCCMLDVDVFDVDVHSLDVHALALNCTEQGVMDRAMHTLPPRNESAIISLGPVTDACCMPTFKLAFLRL